MDRMSAEYQRAVSDFVGREVYYCVSALVSELAKDERRIDDLAGLFSVDDWEAGADNAIEDLDADDMRNLAEYMQPELDLDDDELARLDRDGLRTKLRDLTAEDADAAREICDYLNADPETREVFEHWIVSNWLAEKLAERGECVETDLYGLTVWGRTTTGQAIALDSVICGIYDELHAPADTVAA